MNFKKYHVSKNLFDKSTITTGAFAILTGTRESATYYCSDFIPITATTYYFQNVVSKAIQNAIVVYDANKQGLRYITIPGSGAVSGAVTFEEGDAYIRINCLNTTDVNTVMVNLGSTPQPYSSEVWHDIPHYIHNTSTDTITTLPAVVYPNATTATVGLKGQAVQSSTPSPTSPVMPDGCGNKTANLLDVTLFHNGYHINSQGNIETFTGRIATTTPIDVSNYTSVTFSYTTTRDNDNFIYVTFSGNTLVERVAGKTSGFTIDTTNCDKLYLCLYNLSSQVLTADIITAMLNEGSTALPYEPFGVKIPISSAGQTTPVYLGEVESTRLIRELVLTGEEDWILHPSIASWFSLSLSDVIVSNIELCTHYKPSPFTPAQIQNGEILVNFDGGRNYRIIIRDTSYSTAADFKTYLQQQYANGTPVTVWYVLATEQTGIVNEPLMRIGDYADTLSNVSIPVTAGGDTLSVDTTVQPSEVTVNYKGWHPVADVHERENGQWD